MLDAPLQSLARLSNHRPNVDFDFLIYWLDGRLPGKLGALVRGGFGKGIGVFCGDDCHDVRLVRVHYLWTRIPGRSTRREQAFSADKGASWEAYWFMDFTRV